MGWFVCLFVRGFVCVRIPDLDFSPNHDLVFDCQKLNFVNESSGVLCRLCCHLQEVLL